MKKLNKQLLIITISSLILLSLFPYLALKTRKNVQATGDLEITFNDLPLSGPVFYLEDTKPGDHICREIDVANNGGIARFIVVKGVKTGGVALESPLLEEVLEIVISEDSDMLYGDESPTGIKTVEDFFNDSTSENGVLLSAVDAVNATTYEFCVDFPSSAGNEYQEKSVIFDLVFGIILEDNLKINEVYYQCDSEHGSECDYLPCHINAEISGNAAGSTNNILIQVNNTCLIQQTNILNINNSINISSNTGDNSTSSNTGGVFSIITGIASSIVNIFNFGNINIASCDCCCECAQNDEWIEIYNPTDRVISLRNWILEDNSGQEIRLRTRQNLRPGEFVLISKSRSTWGYWNEDPDAKKIYLGKLIGDGLDNAGDHIFLKNTDGDLVDAVAWGDDTEVWDPAVPLVSEGSSIERLIPGFDNDLVSDWEEKDPPTPGN